MKYVKHFLLYIFVGGGLLYLIVNYFPGLGFSIQSDYANSFIIYLFLGFVSWIFNVIIKKIVKLLTLPISMLTFGLISLINNFLILYVFEQFVNYLDIGIIINLGNIVQVFVLSCLLSFVYFVIKKI